MTLWVGGPGTTAWPTQTNQKIKLIADQENYQPGDTATIFIPNPFPDGALALVTVERHKVFSYETYSITASGQEVKIPLGDEDAPNVYLAVTLIGQDPDGRSSFRQGYINLLVEPVNQLLNVEVVGEPENLGPGEEVQFTLRVTDQDGKPRVGEFSLAVVDKAVLALTEPTSSPIAEAFLESSPSRSVWACRWKCTPEGWSGCPAVWAVGVTSRLFCPGSVRRYRLLAGGYRYR